eukprot:TRINITY_DN47343_c0_g1_i1.p1 TRINITY_DN47343_c0_g1~~TRINITY_DN47343_c0_g1_i1.p1  ORF type:complete len:897 (-),score=221.27 TRINITY_DN47343_c0_g1_i1:8-2455(-)
MLELFGGQLPEKPEIPSTKDGKIEFLQRWLDITMASLGASAGELVHVSVQNVVCGTAPEWTNYMLQCIAVAAHIARPPPEPVAEYVQAAAVGEGAVEVAAAEQVVAEQAVLEPSDGQALPPDSAPPLEPAPDGLAAPLPEAAPLPDSAPEHEAAPPPLEAAAPTPDGGISYEAPDASVAVVAEPEVAEVSAAPLPAAEPIDVSPTIDVEEARKIAEGMDFSSCLKDFNMAHEELARTAGEWHFKPSGSPIPPDADMEDQDGGDEAAEVAVASAEADFGGVEPLPAPPADERPTTALKTAALKAQKVTSSMQQAADLLETIEAGLDGFEETVRQKKEREAEERAAAEAAQLQSEADRNAREAERIAREEAEAAEAARAEEERLRRRAENTAARLAKQAKEEAKAAAEEAKKRAQFPMSKTAMEQGARIVSCVGEESDEEYKWDGDEEEAQDAAAAAPAAAPPPPLVCASGDLGACLTDDLLAPDTSAPAEDPMSFLTKSPEVVAGKLLDRLKAQLQDTFVSYLCASMPESLLRQYDGNELVQCLQVLLAELRKCIADNGLEDVNEEDPTSVTEVLREEHPHDWLNHLQNGSAWALNSKHTAPDVVDTLQNLSQICLERLEDALGPLQSWLPESSLLRYVPSAVPAAPLDLGDTHCEPTSADAESPTPAAPSPGPWSAELGAAPWEQEMSAPPATAAPSRPLTQAANVAPQSLRLGTAPPMRGAAAGGGPPPTFSAALGPAPWEAQASASHGAAGAPPATASRPPVFNAALGPAPWEQPGAVAPMPRAAMTAAPGARGGTAHAQQRRPLTQGVGFSR